MSCDRLDITSADVALLVSHVRSGSPHEVCGFLAGVGGYVTRVYPVRNVAQHPTLRFEMDRLEQVRTLIDINRHGWEVLAVYHSHPPGARPDPSRADLVENTYPGAVMLIAQPDAFPDCVRLRAFCADGNKVRSVDLRVAVEDNQTITRSTDGCY